MNIPYCDSTYGCRKLGQNKTWKTSFSPSFTLFSMDPSLDWRSSFFCARKLQLFYSGKTEQRGKFVACILNFSEQLYIYKWKLWKAFKELTVEILTIIFSSSFIVSLPVFIAKSIDGSDTQMKILISNITFTYQNTVRMHCYSAFKSSHCEIIF